MSFPYIVQGKIKLSSKMMHEILEKKDYVIVRVVSDEKECHLLIKRGSEEAWEETIKIDQLRDRKLKKEYPKQFLYAACIATLFNRISEYEETISSSS
jgi:hypothetical protein